VDAFSVGEHHRPDFAVSAPDTVLAGLATATRRIKLGSAVVVLSSDDPIRVYERFATIDALSSGRAEPVLGRGSFIESFPLYGFDLADYEKLFEEKLEVFAAPQGAAGHLVGQLPDALDASTCSPRPRVRTHERVGRRRRFPAVGRPRRPLRLRAAARDHRRPGRPASSRSSISTTAP
jgi:alkanesulfonate monooxygenase SsuD/methylene tetrahydromethanopterin reductase-like flavin-dependent oxidoreductase (luciferase family)